MLQSHFAFFATRRTRDFKSPQSVESSLHLDYGDRHKSKAMHANRCTASAYSAERTELAAITESRDTVDPRF